MQTPFEHNNSFLSLLLNFSIAIELNRRLYFLLEVSGDGSKLVVLGELVPTTISMIFGVLAAQRKRNSMSFCMQASVCVWLIETRFRPSTMRHK